MYRYIRHTCISCTYAKRVYSWLYLMVKNIRTLRIVKGGNNQRFQHNILIYIVYQVKLFSLKNHLLTHQFQTQILIPYFLFWIFQCPPIVSLNVLVVGSSIVDYEVPIWVESVILDLTLSFWQWISTILIIIWYSKKYLIDQIKKLGNRVSIYRSIVGFGYTSRWIYSSNHLKMVLNKLY